MRHALRLLLLGFLVAFTTAPAQAEVYENDYIPGFGRFRFEIKDTAGEPQVVVILDRSYCQFTAFGSPTPCELQQSQPLWEPRLIGDGVGVDHIEGQWSRFRFDGVDELAKFRIIRLNQTRTRQALVRLLILSDDGRVEKVYRLNKVED